jgi:pimeloyl-ACP methyl ester carboxylesterase
MKKLWTGLAVLAVLAAAGAYWVNKSASGIPGFYAWKAVTGAPQSAGKLPVNGIDLYYEVYGEGPPVIVLHGGTGFIESMHYQIRALSAGHRVIAIDSRGHGRSSEPEGALHYTDMAGDVTALMDHLGLAQADVVGWSDGGIIGLLLAVHAPERVGKVVAIGANYDVSGTGGDFSSLTADHEAFAAARGMYEHLAADPAHWPVFFEKIITMWQTEPLITEAELRGAKTPILVMAGEFDSIKPEHTEKMAALLPDGELHIVPGGTHFIPLEKPDEVNAAMLAFLEK